MCCVSNCTRSLHPYTSTLLVCWFACLSSPQHNTQASTLVLVEHRNNKVAAPTLNTLAAAGKLGGGGVTALVSGKGVQQVAQEAAALPGVDKVSTTQHNTNRVSCRGGIRLSEKCRDCLCACVPVLHLVTPHTTCSPPRTILFFLVTAVTATIVVVVVTQVLVADAPALEHNLAEPHSEVVAALQQQQGGYSHILAPSSTYGKNLLPRTAALLGVQPVADVVQVCKCVCTEVVGGR